MTVVHSNFTQTCQARQLGQTTSSYNQIISFTSCINYTTAWWLIGLLISVSSASCVFNIHFPARTSKSRAKS